MPEVAAVKTNAVGGREPCHIRNCGECSGESGWFPGPAYGLGCIL